MNDAMVLNHRSIVWVSVGCLLAASACSNLTSPAGEDPDSLPPVQDDSESIAPKPTRPRRLPDEPAADRHGSHHSALVHRILIAYRGAEGAKPGVTRSKSDARKLANEILAKLNAPKADFAALAKKHSDAPDAARGGAIPPITPKTDIDPELKAAAFRTSVGTHSGVVDTKRGFLILQRVK